MKITITLDINDPDDLVILKDRVLDALDSATRHACDAVEDFYDGDWNHWHRPILDAGRLSSPLIGHIDITRT